MTDHIQLSAFHVFVVAPFFLYVAFVRGQLMPWVFTALQVLGLVVLLFHAYRIMTRWKAQSLTVWVNILHVVAVAPILLYIGCMGYDTPRWAYEILAMLGFSALGYHIYQIVLSVQKMHKDVREADSNKVLAQQSG
jgi:threonine/homoserine/homoserine lactone efflux protein